MGLRSLMRAEKRLHERHGAWCSAASTRPSATSSKWRACGTLPADRAICGRGRWRRVPWEAWRPNGRRGACATGAPRAVWPLAGAVFSRLGTAAGRGAMRDADAVDVHARGPGICVGGAVSARPQQSESRRPGPLLVDATFAVATARRDAGIADFLVPENPSDALVHVAFALGWTARRTFALKVACEAALRRRDLVDDNVAIAAETASSDVSRWCPVIRRARLASLATSSCVVVVTAAMSRAETGFDASTNGWAARGCTGRPVRRTRSLPCRAPQPTSAWRSNPMEVIRTVATSETLDSISDVDPRCAHEALVWGYPAIGAARRTGEAAVGRGGRRCNGARGVGDHRPQVVPRLPTDRSDASSRRLHVEDIPRGELRCRRTADAADGSEDRRAR